MECNEYQVNSQERRFLLGNSSLLEIKASEMIRQCTKFTLKTLQRAL